MSLQKVLIANRGEISLRITRACADLGIETVAVYSEDDEHSRHVLAADASVPLVGIGVSAYLSIDALIRVARSQGCDALHPGYGFLSESAQLARACAKAEIVFVGPTLETLETLGDKAAARKLANDLGVPLLPGTQTATSLKDAESFRRSLNAGETMMLKALSGGGGRGIRMVRSDEDLERAYSECATEARKAFGNDALYVELMVSRARHIEVQIVGDGADGIAHLGERECTLQRRNQKLIEIAPAPGLPRLLRDKITQDSLRMARALNYRGLGTFEFLVSENYDGSYWFMEANPRIQVEHTVTEEVTGIDLVQTQLRIAGGEMLSDIGITSDVAVSGCAIQVRLNAETMDDNGSLYPSSGQIAQYVMPEGPGVRVDGCGYVGYDLNPNFDTLLAKIIVSVRGMGSITHKSALKKARRALEETVIVGFETNIGFLHALLFDDEVCADRIYTRFVEENFAKLAEHCKIFNETRQFNQPALNVITDQIATQSAPVGCESVLAPLPGIVGDIEVTEGDVIAAGQTIAIIEAMKMEHQVSAPFSGRVQQIIYQKGEQVRKGNPLFHISITTGIAEKVTENTTVNLETIPAMLQQEIDRRALRMDVSRPDAVARRRKTGQRTLRENISNLCDPDTFVEYGGLALASQRRRRTPEDLLKMSPADGMVTGTATINGSIASKNSRAYVIGYDYTVMAGTQGWANHKKLGRMLQIAASNPLPLVIFAEGGGGRPGDTDQMRASGLDTRNFAWMARMSGKKPIVSIVSGRCFAGNAALLGLSDVIIATENATIGMGGPAMIEGGGLGIFTPEEVGPLSIQMPNGVVDIAVKDEAEAVVMAKKYLGFFQGPKTDWTCADQRVLRHIVPENRRQMYDVRSVIEGLCDTESTLELRPQFGDGICTVLARIEGRPVGVIANNIGHISGAIDSPAANKAARFLRLCDTFGLPVISLCDTPGFMVGPESEKTSAVRIFSRLFLAGANVSVPIISVILRKGYGLGAMAMAGGSMHETALTVAWPTAEFGGMGLEGAVRLGYRKELEAISDPEIREQKFQELLEKYYQDGKAFNAASYVEIDDVIDPAETRALVALTLAGYQDKMIRQHASFLDSW